MVRINEHRSPVDDHRQEVEGAPPRWGLTVQFVDGASAVDIPSATESQGAPVLLRHREEAAADSSDEHAEVAAPTDTNVLPGAVFRNSNSQAKSRRTAPTMSGASTHCSPSRPRNGPRGPILVHGFAPGGRKRMRRGGINAGV